MQKKSILFFIVSILITSIGVETVTAQSWNLAGNADATAASKLGTTNNMSVRFYTNNVQRMIINSAAGFVGIGTPTPVNILTVQSSGSAPAAAWLTGLNSPVFDGFAEGVSSEFVLSTASSVAAGRRSVIQGRRSRGTLAAPTVVQNNDFLASFLASGYDGTTFQNPATIDFFVDGVPSAGNVPARISFVTGSNIGNRIERLKVGSTGNFNFNDVQLTINQSTGNVGIGTGNLNFANSLQTIQFPAVPSTTNNPMISMFSSGTTNENRMVIAHSPNYPDWGLQYRDASDEFEFLGFGTSALHVGLGTQRVGIGTTTPAYRLDVAGRMRVQSSDGSAGIWFTNNASTADVAFAGMATDSYVGLFGAAAVGWGFVMNTTSGNIGIGTLSPNYRLDVCGTIRAKEVRVESGWCDYVFEKNYYLRPLESVAAYVGQNKHLPGIPAAKDIQENGLPVAEMQTKMMEKIEELTLYVIQLNEKIKLLEEKNDQLIKRKK